MESCFSCVRASFEASADAATAAELATAETQAETCLNSFLCWKILECSAKAMITTPASTPAPTGTPPVTPMAAPRPEGDARKEFNA